MSVTLGGMREARLIDPGALLATTHEAGGGLRVRLRLARPSDALRVREFLRGLSPETRRARFSSDTAAVLDPLVRRFTFQNPRERLVVAATAPLGGAEQVVGLADIGLAGTGVAELGIVVDDRAQNRGVGKLLTEAVAALAIQRGATHLRAELPQSDVWGQRKAAAQTGGSGAADRPQTGNPVRRLMERLGRTVETVEDGRQVVYSRLPEPRSYAA